MIITDDVNLTRILDTHRVIAMVGLDRKSTRLNSSHH